MNVMNPTPLCRVLISLNLTGATNKSESEPEPDEREEPDASIPDTEKGDRNSQLAVGHGEKNNRTFVVRGDKIGVFKHADEGKVEYAATVKDLGFKRMKGFKPKHVSHIMVSVRSHV